MHPTTLRQAHGRLGVGRVRVNGDDGSGNGGQTHVGAGELSPSRNRVMGVVRQARHERGRDAGAPPLWIPACAGMTDGGAGVTVWVAWLRGTPSPLPSPFKGEGVEGYKAAACWRSFLMAALRAAAVGARAIAGSRVANHSTSYSLMRSQGGLPITASNPPSGRWSCQPRQTPGKAASQCRKLSRRATDMASAHRSLKGDEEVGSS